MLQLGDLLRLVLGVRVARADLRALLVLVYRSQRVLLLAGFCRFVGGVEQSLLLVSVSFCTGEAAPVDGGAHGAEQVLRVSISHAITELVGHASLADAHFFGVSYFSDGLQESLCVPLFLFLGNSLLSSALLVFASERLRLVVLHGYAIFKLLLHVLELHL